MSKLAVCTIVTKNYLPYARTLASSLVEHNPDIDLYVLLADRVDNYFDPSLESFKFIYLEDLSDQENIEKMCFYYTAFELCCALRGALHEYMFEKTNSQKWIFLDSDIMVHNSLNVIFEQLESSSILLTPHRTTPLPNDCVNPYELNFLKNGLYNAGFLGLSRTDISRKFIGWFKDRLKDFSFNDFYNNEYLPRGLFVDQLWLNLVPLYFDKVNLCLEPGANLGHWNLLDSNLSKDENGNIMVDESPLLFTHFSGWDINNIDKVSTHAPIYNEKTPSLWIDMSKCYRDKLLENEYEKFIDIPYTFNYLKNGKSIDLEMRRRYYDFLICKSEILTEYNPFSDGINSQTNISKVDVPDFNYLVNNFKIRIKNKFKSFLVNLLLSMN